MKLRNKQQVLLLLLDILVIVSSILIAWLMRFITANLDIYSALTFALVAIIVYCSFNYLLGLYHHIWKYASSSEIALIGASVLAGTLLLLVLDVIWPYKRPVPLSVVIIAGTFIFIGFLSVRYHRPMANHWLWRSMLKGTSRNPRKRVLIVGAGEAGQLLAWRFLNQKEGEEYSIIGFVDDDPLKQGLRIHGIPILGNRYDIPELVTRYHIDMIILAIYNISGEDFRAIVDICLKTPAAIKTLPNLFDFVKGTNTTLLVRDITAEDLLGRKQVAINLDQCGNLLMGKTVIVTGGAGSIGSELCRQILSFRPGLLLIVDNNESGLYDLTQDLLMREEENQFILKPIVGDVTNEREMRSIFESFRPQIVFHAAAYKHVPLMEEYPDRAIRVNILGTKIVSSLAAQYGAEIFVLISTDKAVNPCSVMGATKRICEMMILFTPSQSAPFTKFTAVRFGNVLGSRGSVVPLFERQITQGGPVTITHPHMTRYFMSISEAVRLIIQAAALTQGGDIFLLDMGQQIRIEDLARRLIRLRGLRPDIDIPIVYVGPRPGEKMSEELLDDSEVYEPTSHPRIFRVKSNYVLSPHEFWQQTEELIASLNTQSSEELKNRLMNLVNSLSKSG